jgi:predicted metal-dependent hydrolase
MHGREHEDYNRLLAQAGFPVQKLERRVARLLKFTQAITPASWQLASTIALEHFTAILADRLLGDDALLRDSVEPFRDLWLWHSIEETEHKAVAYDVWQQAVGRGAGAYVLRAGGMVVTGAFFVSMIAAFSAEMIESDPALKGKRGGYLQLLKFLLGRGGLVRSGFPAWLDYFRPSFHPWQHDNRALLKKLDQIEQRVNRVEFAKAA